MAQQINASFIPKKEVRARAPRVRSVGANLFLLIGVIVFLTALLASLGVFLWGEQLDAQNSRSLQSLTDSREDFAIATIQEFIEVNSRLESAESILDNHINVTEIFDILEQDTLQDIYLSNFSFDTQGSEVVISARGYAPTYAHVALQADQYSANNLINDLILSGVNQAREGGIQFDLNFSLERDILIVTN